jgi:D-2-hydroxyacid dehydrogenase (NADP+)
MNVLLASFDGRLLGPRRRRQLMALAAPLKLVITVNPVRLEKLVRRAEIIVGRVPGALLQDAPNLRWYQQFGTGVEWLEKYPDVAAMDFALTNVSDQHFASAAAHAIAVLLTMVRQLPEAWRNQAARKWSPPSPNDPGLWDLAGKRLMLLGLGSIGREIARLAVALRMDVVAVRAHPNLRVRGIDAIVGPGGWHRLLKRMDVIVNALPLTPRTRGMIGRRAFARMRSGALFINVGRGGTVDEDSLIEALRLGRLGGAALDVFAEEPLPRASPFWSMRNVIITAHYAGASESIFDRFIDVALDNLRRYRQRRPLRNLVDKRQYSGARICGSRSKVRELI